MVKKKSPVVLLTIVGVALAGAIVMNARGHQPDITQAPDGPASTPQTGQAAQPETKDSIFGSTKADDKKLKPIPTSKPAVQPVDPKPQIPRPSAGDVSSGWYSSEGHH
jgi:hypothetical protein